MLIDIDPTTRSSKTLFIAATHGNESYSIPVMEAIEERFPKDEYTYDWMIGNPLALAQGVRYVMADMNRVAPGDSESQLYEERRAAELVRIASMYDRVVDIHGSSSICGPTTLIPFPNSQNISLAAEFQLERNMVWYSEKSAARGPLAQHMPVPAIELEFGPKDDPEVSRQLYDTIANYLRRQKLGALGHQATQMMFYDVYGKCFNATTQDVYDFGEVELDGEAFYAYMVRVYQGVTCYKARLSSYSEIIDKYKNVG